MGTRNILSARPQPRWGRRLGSLLVGCCMLAAPLAAPAQTAADAPTPRVQWSERKSIGTVNHPRDRRGDGPAVAAAPAVAAPAAAAVAAAATGEDTERLIVRYRAAGADASGSQRAALSARAQDTLSRRGVQAAPGGVRGHGALLLQLDRRVSLATAQALARDLQAADSRIESVEPDRRLQLHALPTDPRLPEQWHLGEVRGSTASSALNLPAAWDKTTGTGVVVAVIDTGVRPHADLAANLLPGYDFISDTAMAADGDGRDADASDVGNGVAANECGAGAAARNSLWHGTHVAGSIAASGYNGSGGVGVAFGARVLPVRVMGKCGGYLSDVADAIVWSAGAPVDGVPLNPNPARVINLSMGMAGSCGATLQAAIQTARARGAVVIASAGNTSGNAGDYAPANCTGVITVTAVDRAGKLTFYANTGSGVSIAAPGGDMRTAVTDGILSTYNNGVMAPGPDTMGYLQGTSMAAPLVSGVAALMLAHNPTLNPDEVEARLKSSARPFGVPCKGCGAGLLDAAAAVDAAFGVVDTVGANATTPATTPASASDPRGAGTPPPPVVEREPNNSLATAHAIAPMAVRIEGSLANEADTDHYRVSIGAGKTLQVQLSPSSESDYDLALYSDTGQLLLSRTSRNNQGESMVIRNVNAQATATVFLRVIYVSGGSGPVNGRYTLALTQ